MIEKKSKEKYSISELAGEFNISPRSIRFYEEKNLLNPKRTKGNQRIYAKSDRARLKLIMRGKRFGYSLEEIGEMIGMTSTDFDEIGQINKSLEYGIRKLKEIREAKAELEMMEQDMLKVKDKLMIRLKEIEGANKQAGEGR